MKLAALVVGCALLGACEKAGDHNGLSAEEMSMLRDLPGGNTVIIGGNYLKVQGLMDGTLGKIVQRSMSQDTGVDPASYKAWSNCLMDMPHLRIAGGLELAGDLDMRFVFRGMSIADLSSCASKASYHTALDPDGKYIAIDVPGQHGQVVQAGYMALPDGTILLDQHMALGLTPTLEQASRGKLEAIAGKLSTDNATGDTHLIELATKADRTKLLWFAGSGARTPLASKVGDFFGSFDMPGGGIAIDGTVTFTDTALAAKIEGGLARARGTAGTMPPVFKTVIDGVKLERTGATVHVSSTVTADQISQLAALSGLQ